MGIQGEIQETLSGTEIPEPAVPGPWEAFTGAALDGAGPVAFTRTLNPVTPPVKPSAEPESAEMKHPDIDGPESENSESETPDPDLAPFGITARSGLTGDQRQEEIRTREYSESTGIGASAKGRNAEGQKKNARDYHDRMTAYLLAGLPDGDTSGLPHHNDEVNLMVDGQPVKLSQGELFALARQKATDPSLSPEERLYWAQMAVLANPEHAHDPAAMQAHIDAGVEAHRVRPGDLEQEKAAVKNIRPQDDLADDAMSHEEAQAEANSIESQDMMLAELNDAALMPLEDDFASTTEILEPVVAQAGEPVGLNGVIPLTPNFMGEAQLANAEGLTPEADATVMVKVDPQVFSMG